MIYIENCTFEELHDKGVTVNGAPLFSITESHFFCKRNELISFSSQEIYVSGKWVGVQFQTGMRVYSVDVSCSFCSAGAYSLLGGDLEFSGNGSAVTVNPQCISCPYGLDCSNGSKLEVWPNFWATEWQGSIYVYDCLEGCCNGDGRCPLNYCEGSAVSVNIQTLYSA